MPSCVLNLVFRSFCDMHAVYMHRNRMRLSFFLLEETFPWEVSHAIEHLPVWSNSTFQEISLHDLTCKDFFIGQKAFLHFHDKSIFQLNL